MSAVTDITPLHEPIALAREMVERAPDATAAVCILVKSDGSLWYDMSGHRRVDVMWALQRMIHVLMSE